MKIQASSLRNEQGLAFLSYGFRPFFLAGALYSGLAIAIWMPVYFDELTLHTTFAPLDWHIHEMLFGFLPAVIAGFLLTAIPNWTGRPPVRGNLLLMMAVVWVCGRVAVACSGQIGWRAAMLVDASFLLLAGAVAAREVLAAKNLRNMRVVALVLLLFACNVAFHIEAHVQGVADYSVRAGIAIVVLLISVIAGRIVPAFTRIWLMRRPQGAMPVPFSRFDGLAVALGAFALVAWVVRPDGMLTGGLCLIAGLFHFARLVRWAGYRTWANKILVILHIGYAFVPLGFVLAGMSAFGVVGVSAAIHAWMAGGAGIMTLAVMSRATFDAATTRPPSSRTGDMVTEMSMTRPSFETRTVSNGSTRSPRRSLSRITTSSSSRSGGMSMVIGRPTASRLECPKSRSAPAFQERMMPSRSLLTIASSDDSTMAASRA